MGHVSPVPAWGMRLMCAHALFVRTCVRFFVSAAVRLLGIAMSVRMHLEARRGRPSPPGVGAGLVVRWHGMPPARVRKHDARMEPRRFSRTPVGTAPCVPGCGWRPYRTVRGLC